LPSQNNGSAKAMQLAAKGEIGTKHPRKLRGGTTSKKKKKKKKKKKNGIALGRKMVSKRVPEKERKKTAKKKILLLGYKVNREGEREGAESKAWGKGSGRRN